MTINEVLLGLATQPYKVLVIGWNWKSALLSSSFRALIFFSVNISEGWSAASGAMLGIPTKLTTDSEGKPAGVPG